MQISKDKLKSIRLQRIGLFLMGASLFSQFQINPSISNGLSPFNQIFLLTELHSKILLNNTIPETSEINFDSLAISQDGQTIISCSKDKTIKVHNLKTGKLINTIAGNADESGRMVISPDGQMVASSTKDSIQILDLRTGLLKTTIPYKDKAGVSNFFFSADGQTLVSQGSGYIIELISDQNKANSNSMFHKDKKDKNTNTIEIWDVNTGKLKTTLSCENCVEHLFAISPNGQTIVSSGQRVSYYDLPTRTIIWSNTIKTWDVSTGKVKTSFALINTKDLNKFIDTLTISPDGQTFVTRSERKTVKIWDINTGNLKATLPNPNNNEMDLLSLVRMGRLYLRAIGVVSRFGISIQTR
jgi:WD40 repeat protein